MKKSYVIYCGGYGFLGTSKRIDQRFTNDIARARLFNKKGYARRSIDIVGWPNASIIEVDVGLSKESERELMFLTLKYGKKPKNKMIPINYQITSKPPQIIF